MNLFITNVINKIQKQEIYRLKKN